MNNAGQSPETALKRYEVVMAHLRFDHTVFWTRFGFMLVSQVGMFGIFINLLLATRGLPAHVGLWSCLPVCAVGLILVGLFDGLRVISSWWIERWIKILKANEAAAFGDIELFRNASPPCCLKAVGARQLAAHFMHLFAAIWVGAVATTVIRAML
jgi:hypothetical protein